MSEISIFADDASTCNPRNVAAYLHRHRRKVHSNILKSLPDQGKVARCLQTCHFYCANNWSFDGTGMRFCNWRFIHRARTMDMSKAFDKVSHAQLMHRLHEFGFRGNLLNWFSSYLSNRYQQTTIGGATS